MPDLEQLRSLSGEVHPPAFDSLEKVAGRRDRRATVSVALASVAAVVAVVAGGLLVVDPGADHPEPAPFVPTTRPPTPDRAGEPTAKSTHASKTSMTPKEVVLADDATLELTGVSLDDPDFRVSQWRATCHWCPRSEVGRPSFTALAITSDGYAAATYRRAPFDSGLEHVESVGPGLLVIVDRANGYEWLVRDDGTLTPLDRDFDEIPAADPRLWFVCLANTGHGSGGAAEPFDSQPTWCALDPHADTVHIWTGPWVGTLDDSEPLVSPGSGEMSWGVRDPSYGPTRASPEVDRVEVWWEVDGSRHHEDLGAATASGPVLNGPRGLMSCWSWVKGSPTLTVFTSSDQGNTWRSITLGTDFRPDPYGGLSLSWTPGGDLVGREDSPHSGNGLRLWRARPVDGGHFEVVYEAPTGNQYTHEDRPFTVSGERLWASRLWSDDDGETWVEEATWR